MNSGLAAGPTPTRPTVVFFPARHTHVPQHRPRHRTVPPLSSQAAFGVPGVGETPPHVPEPRESRAGTRPNEMNESFVIVDGVSTWEFGSVLDEYY